MTASERILVAIKSEEGFRPTAYADSTGMSIGYGTFIDEAAEQYLLDATIDEEQAENLLRAHVQRMVSTIRSRINVELNQNQLDALVMLTYNAGPAPITSGSLDNLINARESEQVIRAKWMEYNKSRDTANGPLIVRDFLTARRAQEVALYFTPVGSIRPDQKKKY